jgi:hypothetical protein
MRDLFGEWKKEGEEEEEERKRRRRGSEELKGEEVGKIGNIFKKGGDHPME